MTELFQYALRRALRMAGGILVAMSFMFALLWVVPDGPFLDQAELISASKGCEPTGDIFEEYGALLGSWGLFEPSTCAGQSRVFPGRAIYVLVVDAFPVTLVLVATAMLAALVLGGTLGIAAAAWPSSIAARICQGLHALGIAVPNVVLGPLLVLVFSLQLGWFPPALGADTHSWVLPAITLGTACAGGIADVLHRALLASLWSAPVLLARTQGASRWRLLTRYVARDAVLPVLTFLGPATSSLLAGTLIVEGLFALPGLGSLFVAAAMGFDLGLVCAVVLVYMALFMGSGLLQDILYGVLDPRVRFDV
ncbi:MAG: ABC transporter permease [Myxococcota bacterium]